MTDKRNSTATTGTLLHLLPVGIVAIVITILFGGAVFSLLNSNKSVTEVRGASAIEDKILEPVTAIGHDAGSIPAEADPPGSVAIKTAAPSDPQNPLSHPIEKDTEAKADVALAPQAIGTAVPESLPGPAARDYAELIPVEEPPNSAATKMPVSSEAQNSLPDPI